MEHLVTSVVPLLFQDGGLGRFVNPFTQSLTDITSLEPVLLQLIVFGLLSRGVYALTVLGLMMIFGVMGVINFTYSILLVAGTYSAWLVSETTGIGPLLGIPIAAAVLFALGMVVYTLTVEPIIGTPQQDQLIVTLDVFFIIQSAIGIIFTPDPQQIELSLGLVQIGDMFIPFEQSYVLVIAFEMIPAVRTFLSRIDLDRKIRGTADNHNDARYVGINIRRTNHLTFGIGVALAGVAGGSIALFQRFDPFMGETYPINAFVIVILGNLGSFPDAFADGLIVRMIQVFGGYYLPGTTAQVFIFLLFIEALLVKPEGLLGDAEA